MPRQARSAPGGLVYHVLNRANGGYEIFAKEQDYLAFERVLSQAREALPGGYGVRTESAAMARTLDRLAIDRPVDLIGHSFGALVALDYALDHPHRIHTLTLMEPPAFWVVPAAEVQQSTEMRTMIELTRELRPDRPPSDDQLTRFRCALGACGEKPPRAGDAGWDDWVRRRSALRGLSAVVEHTDDPARLETFRRPVLIMTGAETASFHRRITQLPHQHGPRSTEAW